MLFRSKDVHTTSALSAYHLQPAITTMDSFGQHALKDIWAEDSLVMDANNHLAVLMGDGHARLVPMISVPNARPLHLIISVQRVTY